MKRLITAIATLGLGSALMAVAPAMAGDKYKIDEHHVWMVYQISHRPGANETGGFEKVSGDIDFDKADVTKSSVQLEIATASLHTGFDQRDKDLSSPDFFNTAEFPKMTFKSTKIEKTGDNTAKVTGDFTLLGVTKPVTLDVSYSGEGALPWDAKTLKVGFSARGSLRPADFGMNKVTEYGFGPDVSLILELEAMRPAS